MPSWVPEMFGMGMLYYYKCKWKTKFMQANGTQDFFMSNWMFDLVEIQTFFSDVDESIT